MRINPDMSNGRYCMKVVSEFVLTMPQKITLNEFCKDITVCIDSKYENFGISKSLLIDHPEDRMTASAIIYSAYWKQIWMVGDCQCLVNGTIHENPKPQEGRIAEKRSSFLRKEIARGTSVKQMQKHDLGRDHIIEDLVSCLTEQNIEYPVIDGFLIPTDKVKTIDVSKIRGEIVLASDGFPFLKPTLRESEDALRQQLDNDPLCIETFKATKGLMEGNRSFDDRSYIRFKI